MSGGVDLFGEPAGPPVFAMTTGELADLMGVTTRRIRQLREDGALIPAGRGRIDSRHAINAMIGRRWLGGETPGVNTFAEAAIGWLLGHRSRGVHPEDLELWLTMCEGWGLTRAEATVALFNAGRMLGETAGPRFHGAGHVARAGIDAEDDEDRDPDDEDDEDCDPDDDEE